MEEEAREVFWGGDTNALMAWCNGNGYWADDGVVVSERGSSQGNRLTGADATRAALRRDLFIFSLP